MCWTLDLEACPGCCVLGQESTLMEVTLHSVGRNSRHPSSIKGRECLHLIWSGRKVGVGGGGVGQ